MSVLISCELFLHVLVALLRKSVNFLVRVFLEENAEITHIGRSFNMFVAKLPRRHCDTTLMENAMDWFY